jgi:hypothetical protein
LTVAFSALYFVIYRVPFLPFCFVPNPDYVLHEQGVVPTVSCLLLRHVHFYFVDGQESITTIFTLCTTDLNDRKGEEEGGGLNRQAQKVVLLSLYKPTTMLLSGLIPRQYFSDHLTSSHFQQNTCRSRGNQDIYIHPLG